MKKYDFGYYKDNFVEKFNDLLDIQYSDVPKNKRRRKFYEEYENQYFSDVEKKAKNWFRKDYNTRGVPDIETLINICNLLHCDFDYFLTSQHEYNSDVTISSKTTGLTKKSVENLFNMNYRFRGRNVAVLNLNYLIGVNSEKGFNLLSLIYRYLFGNYDRTSDGNDSIEFMDETGIACNGVEISISDLNDLFMPMIQGQLQRIKNDITNSADKWKNYGKYIPTEKDYEEQRKNNEAENKRAKEMIEKYRDNPDKQKFWENKIKENESALEELRNEIDKSK